MRLVILTGFLNGLASLCVPYLATEPEVEIAGIIYNQGHSPKSWKNRKRKIKKVLNIGILGAINGIKMRPWFKNDVYNRLNVVSLDVLAKQLNIKFESTPTINCKNTANLLTEFNADLGISLGNGYIGEKIFSTPKYGMINIHHEILPEYQGAQSIIWQIYNGSLTTGYTIHQINKHIDTGGILYQEKINIELQPTFRETVIHNCARLYEASAKGLVKLVKNYQSFADNITYQQPGKQFTTPNFHQYIRMKRQYKKLYKNHQ
jgi:methionyl-tRNA formyltransferase